MSLLFFMDASWTSQITCSWIGSKTYFGTGVNGGTYLDDFWGYDPTTDSWLQKATFPGGPREEAVGFSIDNNGYLGIVGNGDQSDSYTDFYEYDPITDAWSTKASMVGSGRADAGLLPTSTNIYVIGGINFPNFSGFSSCQMFDPSTNLWSSAPAYGGAVIIAPVVVNINGIGYAGTGFNNALSIRKDWWEFTPANATGIDVNKTEKFNFYPNPVNDILTIESKRGKRHKGIINLCDETELINSKAIYSKKIFFI